MLRASKARAADDYEVGFSEKRSSSEWGVCKRVVNGTEF
jgi:hypothetical protein